MKESIPAHVKITCDRCKSNIPEKHRHLEIAASFRGGMQSQDSMFFDLCDECSKEFTVTFIKLAGQIMEVA